MSGLAVLGDGQECAGAQHRVAEALGLEGREVEEVRVQPQLGAFGEEDRDETGLTVHVAFRRHGEHAGRALAEVGAGHGRGAAVYPGIVLGKHAEDLKGVDDALVGEGDLVADPAVVDLGRLRTQHDVLDPVSGRPASGVAAAEADAPGGAAVSDDLVAERD